ncbi:MAG: catalase, partial [Tardiphaga sp.]|nr:catalase [Tardiphaga sp.]
PVHSFHRDGAMRVDGNAGSTIPYAPNSKGVWNDQPDFSEPPLEITGAAAHWDHRVDDDHYEQPGNLFRMQTPEQQQIIFANTARALGDASEAIKRRHIANCTKADPAYGAGVAAALGLKAAASPSVAT